MYCLKAISNFILSLILKIHDSAHQPVRFFVIFFREDDLLTGSMSNHPPKREI